jgi:tetratricopeptide (TPR) repeat protein
MKKNLSSILSVFTNKATLQVLKKILLFNPKINPDIDPNDAWLYNSMGYAYSGLGNHQQALTWIKKAIEIDPDFMVDGYDSMGEIYEMAGNRQQAVIYYQKAARLGYENSQKWLQENGYSW